MGFLLQCCACGLMKVNILILYGNTFNRVVNNEIAL